jgi:broad specificity phosphatase PhoE
MIFDLIIVRHGLSCANVWSNKWYGSHIFYYDPELSVTGINISQALAPALQEKIRKCWADEPYVVGGSRMIRAQETAFYMVAQNTKLPVNVYPHIGETGITRDNWSLPKPDQRVIINNRNPAVLKALDAGIDYREPQTSESKSNWAKFMVWATAHPEAFAQGSDKKYRAVIFSHGNFIKTVFPVPGNPRMNNNDAVHTVIDTSKSSNTIAHPPLDYWALNKADPKTSVCPDECKISVCGNTANRGQKNIVNTTQTRRSSRSTGIYSVMGYKPGGKQTRKKAKAKRRKPTYNKRRRSK